MLKTGLILSLFFILKKKGRFSFLFRRFMRQQKLFLLGGRDLFDYLIILLYWNWIKILNWWPAVKRYDFCCRWVGHYWYYFKFGPKSRWLLGVGSIWVLGVRQLVCQLMLFRTLSSVVALRRSSIFMHVKVMLLDFFVT